MLNIYGYFSPTERLGDELTLCPTENYWEAAAL